VNTILYVVRYVFARLLFDVGRAVVRRIVRAMR